MKLKRTLLALCVLAITFSACVRDEDLDLLNRPIHITGQIDPHFGVPIAYTTMDIADVIGLLGDNYTKYIDTSAEDELVRIQFDTVIENYFEFEDVNITPSAAPKAKSEIIYSYDTIIAGEQSFDLLDNLEILDKFSITKALLNWNADVTLGASQSVSDLINDYGVKIYINNIKIKAINTETQATTAFPIMEEDTLMLDNITSGESVEVAILDEVDAGRILKIRPNKVQYEAHIHVDIPNTAFSVDITSQLQDTISIESLTVVSSISTRFPINIKVNHYDQVIDTVPLNVGGSIDTLMQQLDSIEFLDAEVLDSYIILNVMNSLPLTANLNVDICDEHFSSLFMLMSPQDTLIKSAPIKPLESDNSLYVSDGSTPSLVKLKINQERILQLRDAKYIILSTTLNTPEFGNSQQQVAPRCTDNLSVKIYAQILAKANFDMPITDKPIITKGGK